MVIRLKSSYLKFMHGMVTVGWKLVLGTAIATNLCIGALLYVNWQANLQVKNQMDALSLSKDEVNRDLREKIFELQKKYLEIPSFFKIDPREAVWNWLDEHFHFETEQVLEGRPAYKSLYNRTERRDLVNGKYVVQDIDGKIVVSRGLKNEDGEFNDQVKQVVYSGAGSVDQIKGHLDQMVEKAQSGAMLTERIAALGELLANEGLEAENARNAILYKIEEISRLDAALVELRYRKQREMILIAVLTVVLNLVVLYFLTRNIIEKPLSRLTKVIRTIRDGGDMTVPYHKRQDQVGVLSRAVCDFREALERKKVEKQVIEELMLNMSDSIEGMMEKARVMELTAGKLNELAGGAQEQSSRVMLSASETSVNTTRVSESILKMQESIKDIFRQITWQSELVGNVTGSIGQSQVKIQELNEAGTQIHSIVKLVQKIANQTKLLSINANIEAARAGKFGLGFGVVASEVKNLSHETEEATRDISTKINAIQSTSLEIVDEMKKIEELIVNLGEISEKITTAAKEQQTSAGAMTRIAKATSGQTDTVSNGINNVADAAEHTSRLSDEVHACSREVSGLLARLLEDTTQKLKLIAADRIEHVEMEKPERLAGEKKSLEMAGRPLLTH